jgi:triosephosphate isomerase (TIM)
MARKPIIAGNWKMHKTAGETVRFVHELIQGFGNAQPACEVVVAPPFTALESAVRAAVGKVIQVSGQNLHWEAQGAFTGEISAAMLRELGCSHVIIGHSERRQYFGETDETVNRKIKAALREDLIPIFCLGETLEQREAGKTFDVVGRQLTGGLMEVSLSDPIRFVIAYEPVWAIGTGRTATPEQAQEVHAFLRHELAELAPKGFSEQVRLLYGGSVKPDNTRSLLACADIDGGLVGGASLKADDFLGIIKEAT